MVKRRPRRPSCFNVPDVVEGERIIGANRRRAVHVRVESLALQRLLMLHEVRVSLPPELLDLSGTREDETLGHADDKQPMGHDTGLRQHPGLLLGQREVVQDPAAAEDVGGGEPVAQGLDDGRVGDPPAPPHAPRELPREPAGQRCPVAEPTQDFGHGEVDRARALREAPRQRRLARERRAADRDGGLYGHAARRGRVEAVLRPLQERRALRRPPGVVEPAAEPHGAGQGVRPAGEERRVQGAGAGGVQARGPGQGTAEEVCGRRRRGRQRLVPQEQTRPVLQDAPAVPPRGLVRGLLPAVHGDPLQRSTRCQQLLRQLLQELLLRLLVLDEGRPPAV
mmetsp:Transcript_105503/g.308496  ORF Transcript_105503/g.308496 Transcript_105503/m.308496 type:complete len:338 (-) Transcript_105503:1390-2403(-)